MSETELLRAWKADPRRFVREQFGVTPDPWQDEVLAAFPRNQRLAMKACKGPGKTAVLAWLAWNFLVVNQDPKIAATSVSGDNLSDGLWAEMAKWQAKSPLLGAAFKWTRDRIFAKRRPQTWWMSARTWAKSADPASLGETLAGLHGDHILFLLDESGGIPDAVMASGRGRAPPRASRDTSCRPATRPISKARCTAPAPASAGCGTSSPRSPPTLTTPSARPESRLSGPVSRSRSTGATIRGCWSTCSAASRPPRSTR